MAKENLEGDVMGEQNEDEAGNEQELEVVTAEVAEDVKMKEDDNSSDDPEKDLEQEGDYRQTKGRPRDPLVRKVEIEKRDVFGNFCAQFRLPFDNDQEKFDLEWSDPETSCVNLSYFTQAQRHKYIRRVMRRCRNGQLAMAVFCDLMIANGRGEDDILVKLLLSITTTGLRLDQPSSVSVRQAVFTYCWVLFLQRWDLMNPGATAKRVWSLFHSDYVNMHRSCRFVELVMLAPEKVLKWAVSAVASKGRQTSLKVQESIVREFLMDEDCVRSWFVRMMEAKNFAKVRRKESYLMDLISEREANWLRKVPQADLSLLNSVEEKFDDQPFKSSQLPSLPSITVYSDVIRRLDGLFAVMSAGRSAVESYLTSLSRREAEPCLTLITPWLSTSSFSVECDVLAEEIGQFEVRQCQLDNGDDGGLFIMIELLREGIQGQSESLFFRCYVADENLEVWTIQPVPAANRQFTDQAITPVAMLDSASEHSTVVHATEEQVQDPDSVDLNVQQKALVSSEEVHVDDAEDLSASSADREVCTREGVVDQSLIDQSAAERLAMCLLFGGEHERQANSSSEFITRQRKRLRAALLDSGSIDVESSLQVQLLAEVALILTRRCRLERIGVLSYDWLHRFRKAADDLFGCLFDIEGNDRNLSEYRIFVGMGRFRDVLYSCVVLNLDALFLAGPDVARPCQILILIPPVQEVVKNDLVVLILLKLVHHHKHAHSSVELNFVEPMITIHEVGSLPEKRQEGSVVALICATTAALLLSSAESAFILTDDMLKTHHMADVLRAAVELSMQMGELMEEWEEDELNPMGKFVRYFEQHFRASSVHAEKSKSGRRILQTDVDHMDRFLTAYCSSDQGVNLVQSAIWNRASEATETPLAIEAMKAARGRANQLIVDEIRVSMNSREMGRAGFVLRFIRDCFCFFVNGSRMVVVLDMKKNKMTMNGREVTMEEIAPLATCSFYGPDYPNTFTETAYGAANAVLRY